MKLTDKSHSKGVSSKISTGFLNGAIGGITRRSSPRADEKVLVNIAESEPIEIMSSSETNASDCDLSVDIPDTLSSQDGEIIHCKSSSPVKGIKIAPCVDMKKKSENIDEWGDDSVFDLIPSNVESAHPEQEVIEGYDDHDCQHQHNRERFTPESLSLLAESVELENNAAPSCPPTSKGQHIRSAKRKLEIDEETEIQPWIKASNHLRSMKWQQNALQKIHRTKFVQESSPNNEISLYYCSTSMNTFYVRINADAGIARKISIGTKGERPLKIEIDSYHLDNVISSLSSVMNGSTSKKINTGHKGEELTLETQADGSLKISNKFPSDTRDVIASRGMKDYHIQKNISFSVPKSEINILLESLLDTKRFSTFLKDLFDQEFKVFEEVQVFYRNKQHQHFSTKDYYLQCVEQFHTMETKEDNTYPIYLVLENFMKKYQNKPYALLRD